jgi:hypothetical protein
MNRTNRYGLTGMSDYYRDRVRHGGILSNDFICKFIESYNTEANKSSLVVE